MRTLKSNNNDKYFNRIKKIIYTYINPNKKEKKKEKKEKEMKHTLEDNEHVPKAKDENPPVPTIAGNVTKAANLLVGLGANATADGIQTVAKKLGLDPNKSVEESVREVYHMVVQLNQALATPEGQALKGEVAKLLQEMVETLEPSVKKAEDILLESATRLGKNGFNAAIEVATVAPPILAVFEASNAIASLANVAKTGLKLASTGMEAAHEVQTQHGPQAKSLFLQLTELVNKMASNGLDMVKAVNDNYGHRVANELQQQPQQLQQEGGGALAGKQLSTYQKEAKMIGGRIMKSHIDFLYPLLHHHKTLHNKKKNQNKNKKKKYLSKSTTTKRRRSSHNGGRGG